MVSLNVNETKKLIVDFRTKAEHPSLHIRGVPVERVSSTKVLGVYITEDLACDTTVYHQKTTTWYQPALAVHSISHLVFVLEGPYVIETRGGEERRRVAEQLAAGAYRKKHLQHTTDEERE